MSLLVTFMMVKILLILPGIPLTCPVPLTSTGTLGISDKLVNMCCQSKENIPNKNLKSPKIF